MKTRNSLPLLALITLLSPCFLHAQTVEEIITLAQKNVGESVMIATVENSKTEFSISATDIIKMKEAHVPDTVMTAMIRHHPGAPMAALVTPRPLVSGMEVAPVGEGTLSLENLDSQSWSYTYEPSKQTIWFSKKVKDTSGTLAPNCGVTLRLKSGSYKLRYVGQSEGPSLKMAPDAKMQAMLTHCSTQAGDELNISIFENGEKVETGRLFQRSDTTPRSNDLPSVVKTPAPVVTSPVVVETVQTPDRKAHV